MVNFSKENLIEVDKSTVAPYSLAIKVNDMVLLCGSDSENGSDSPEGGSEVLYGYINDDGKFQQIEFSGSSAYDVGEPVDCNLKLFQTGQGEPQYAQADNE